jgi:cardiolipin synthase (CMP-forming)
MDTSSELPAAPSRANEWKTVPNLLSFGRLLLTPVLGWLIVKGHSNIATALFAVMGITDYLDGQIARRTNTVTDLGTTLDPVSDRVLVMVALVTMMIGRTDGGIGPHILPLWLGVPILFRELALSATFLLLARRGFGKPKVLRVGKTATFALLCALPALVLDHGLRPLGIALAVVGGLLYYVAGYRYWQEVRTFLEHQRRPFGA